MVTLRTGGVALSALSRQRNRSDKARMSRSPVVAGQLVEQRLRIFQFAYIEALGEPIVDLGSPQPRLAQCGKVTLQRCRIFDRHSLFVHCQREMWIQPEHFGRFRPRLGGLA
jgi:hypothetical protein